VSDEGPFFERLSEIWTGIAQEELNGVFQAWMRQILDYLFIS
jgi:hypothetical protein